MSLAADSSRQEQLWQLQQENKALLAEVDQWRLAAELARDQSAMLIKSVDILTSDSPLDTFLGHVLKTTVDQLEAVGGTLWFPDQASGTARLHLEYVQGHMVNARNSSHPAVLFPPPIGGVPLSTFPDRRAETYLLCYEVAGMPDENRAYIMSLGVKSLLTVPMVLGQETVGWICIRSTRVDHDTMKSQIRVAEALAGQATLAMQMARLSETARQSAVLEERNRIARDIHDTLAQGFTGVVVNLEASSRALKKDDQALAAVHIEHARELAQHGLAEARQSVQALRPHPPDDASIQTELQALAALLQETGAVQAKFECTGEARSIAPEVWTEMIRIAQESTTNVLKHAQANNVNIALAYEPHSLSLTVSDDGLGFELTLDAHDGFGLIGMQERAKRIGARLHIQGRPGQGTRILLSVPLD
ncbi:MAG: GAF domain-containing sensor histidine kinase [Betaproteobacteria bacterium]